jgi:DNA-binding transcriptional LysR family regulator
MTYGTGTIAPLLPEFLARYPDVSIDLNLSDATVDLIGEGYDAAIRIASLPDSSLIARRLCGVKRHVVAAPSYFARYGRPTHPSELADHKCFGYTYLTTPGVWHFTNDAGDLVSVRPSGPLHVNNGEAVMPALIAGLGIGGLPDFIVGEAIARGELETVLDDPERRLSGDAAGRPAPRACRGVAGFPGGETIRRRQAGAEGGTWRLRDGDSAWPAWFETPALRAPHQEGLL